MSVLLLFLVLFILDKFSTLFRVVRCVLFAVCVLMCDVCGVICCVFFLFFRVWCVMCDVLCFFCGVSCVVCGVWRVVCGVWCVVCGVWRVVFGYDSHLFVPTYAHPHAPTYRFFIYILRRPRTTHSKSPSVSVHYKQQKHTPNTSI